MCRTIRRPAPCPRQSRAPASRRAPRCRCRSSGPWCCSGSPRDRSCRPAVHPPATRIVRRVRPGAFGAQASRFERGDDVAQPLLVPTDLREPPLGILGSLLRALQASSLLIAKVAQPLLLVRLLLQALLHVPLKLHQVAALAANAFTQSGYALHQGAIAERQEVQVLVARDEITEAVRGEQDLRGVERAPLVDVHESLLQDGLTERLLILRADEITRR